MRLSLERISLELRPVIIGVIEDDEAVRDSVHALLESYGYDVRAFESAESFLSSADSSPHCFLVDQNMPGMCGLDLIEHLRTEGNVTPAIMLTGRDDAAMRARADRLGITIYRKPVAEEVLISAVRQALPH